MLEESIQSPFCWTKILQDQGQLSQEEAGRNMWTVQKQNYYPRGIYF